MANGNQRDAMPPTRDASEKTPPMTGPARRPMLAASTMRLRLCDFSCSSVDRSTMPAWAIGWVPAVKPVTARPASSSAKLPTTTPTIVTR